jgi:hypothetical protein
MIFQEALLGSSRPSERIVRKGRCTAILVLVATSEGQLRSWVNDGGHAGAE